MSTFDGLIDEFPKIRVDYFRDYPDRRPLACFLSHIHSDHLAGIETLRSPFVYCSAATKEMLLRLERYPCRINYQKGILESRKLKYDGPHLKNILKPLPLETPTVINLSPGEDIRVTLFDANHCPGAVMFLFEGVGKAVLYTGDIRSEPWFVNNIVHNPSMAVLGKYTTEKATLDMIYLDTSFTEDVHFQTKSQGIAELCAKVKAYPPDTIFHFQAWTYGYEDVWVALASELNSRIHVDDYKIHVYRSLVAGSPNRKTRYGHHLAPEGPRLVGFMCGNDPHQGCLTSDENVRIHSCEKGAFCETLKAAQRDNRVVWIRPCIAHLPSGGDIVEAGVGGGGVDFKRDYELEGGLDPEEIREFLETLDTLPATLPEAARKQAKEFALMPLSNGRSLPLNLGASNNIIILKDALNSITKNSLLGRGMPSSKPSAGDKNRSFSGQITFPYARHSSYGELCHFVEAFRPRDVWPCTVSRVDWAQTGTSIRSLFGSYCAGESFRHDDEMEKYVAETRQLERSEDTLSTATSEDTPMHNEPMPLATRSISLGMASSPPVAAMAPGEGGSQTHANGSPNFFGAPEIHFAEAPDDEDRIPAEGYGAAEALADSQSSTLSEHALDIRATSYRAVLENARGNAEFHQIGLISTTDHHSNVEEELGED
ncbi:hypothetical protein GQ53DRAFT_513411 [Thozetella sp. PMI_491]|nr:hypothetical protein GQ53DRAFT_513411 [Thozetella sp. PMI_491]